MGGVASGTISTGTDESTHYSRNNEETLGTTCGLVAD
jgi:hypothetical protein